MPNDAPAELPEAFYVPAGENRFEPTYATESPWESEAQHGGPPTALLGHLMRAVDPQPGFRLARMTVEFLGAVPRQPLETAARVVRPGKRIRLLEAELTVAGRPVALARAWEITTNGNSADPPGLPADIPPPQPQRFFSGWDRWGYGEAIDWRWIHGSLDDLGPAAVWTRPRIPLVAGVPLQPLDRVLLTADAANGISGVVPLDGWLFIPPAATVTVHRHPHDEWVCIDAATVVSGDGIGSTTGTLGDRYGELGSVTQPLLVAPR
ncbi:MAG: thioesterase family protein [Streptosporangiales bacterium]|nr:thioesterase family protein [Streptosporangiales bacterium]